jgi:hypothetical protein
LRHISSPTVVYRYEAENFYATASLRGIDQSAGPAVRSRRTTFRLRAFRPFGTPIHAVPNENG